jgi:hypothetical protein
MNRVVYHDKKIVILEAHSRKYGDMEFIIDAYNFERVIKHHWSINKIHNNFYCTTSIYDREIRKQTSITLHRYLLGALKHDGQIIDHKNCNSLDYREENLRFCTHLQNNQNRRPRKNTLTGFKGVSFCNFKSKMVYRAQIHHNDKDIYLGIFDTPEQAAHKYNEAAKKYFGEYARLNEV